MRDVADGFEATSRGTDSERVIIANLKAMVTLNIPPSPTFNENGERVMVASLEAFTNDLCAKLAKAILTWIICGASSAADTAQA